MSAAAKSNLIDLVREFFVERLAQQQPRPQVRPALGWDEDLNDRRLLSHLEELSAQRLIQYSFCTAPRTATLPDGGKISFSQVAGIREALDRIGFQRFRSQDSESASDIDVMWQLLARFQARDGLFFLSANTHKYENGIRRLLQECVKPILNELHQDRYWLHTIWKSGVTKTPSYATQVSAVVASHVRGFGYTEVTL